MKFNSFARVAAALAYAFSVSADEVHLVNCYGSDTSGVVVVGPYLSRYITCPKYPFADSIIFATAQYCADGVDCDSAVPSNDDICSMSSGSNFVWEGAYDSCTFSTGVTFSWDLSSGVATYAYAG